MGDLRALDDDTSGLRCELLGTDPKPDLTFKDVGDLVFAAVRVRRDQPPGLKQKFEHGIRAVRLSPGQTEAHFDPTDGHGFGVFWREELVHDRFLLARILVRYELPHLYDLGEIRYCKLYRK